MAWSKHLDRGPSPRGAGSPMAALFTLVVLATHRSSSIAPAASSAVARRSWGLFDARTDPTGRPLRLGQVATRAPSSSGHPRRPRLLPLHRTWYQSAQVAHAIRLKRPVLCYNIDDPRGFAFWSKPAQWVGHDGILLMINDEFIPATFYRRWFRGPCSRSRTSPSSGGAAVPPGPGRPARPSTGGVPVRFLARAGGGPRSAQGRGPPDGPRAADSPGDPARRQAPPPLILIRSSSFTGLRSSGMIEEGIGNRRLMRESEMGRTVQGGCRRVAKRDPYSRWRRLPPVFRSGEHKLPAAGDEPQRIILYLKGAVLDQAEELAEKPGFPPFRSIARSCWPGPSRSSGSSTTWSRSR